MIPLPDRTVGLAVGHVMGHDLTAAAAMGQLRSVLRSYAWECDPPEMVLDRLDRLVQGLGMAQLATAWYGRLSPATEDGPVMLRHASAGHLPPLLREPDGTARFLDGDPGLMIGVPAAADRETAVAPLAPASTLVLYTDGLVEAREASVTAGLERLRCAVSSAGGADSPEALCDHLLAELIPGDLADDVALLVVRVN